MGALEFEPAIEVSHNQEAKFEIDKLVEVAKEALSEKSSFTTNMEDDKKAAIAEILRLGISAGGQRAKAIIAYNNETGEVRSGQVEAPSGFDYYLIKLDGVSAKVGFRETENYGQLEYSFYKLAKNCGIEMSECSLIEENGRAHFLTKRFDRKEGKKVQLISLQSGSIEKKGRRYTCRHFAELPILTIDSIEPIHTNKPSMSCEHYDCLTRKPSKCFVGWCST